jgi:hypothetical protein
MGAHRARVCNAAFRKMPEMRKARKQQVFRRFCRNERPKVVASAGAPSAGRPGVTKPATATGTWTAPQAAGTLAGVRAA